jgi:hypothetical protein
MEIIINPEFQKLLPKLSEAVFDDLAKDIMKDGCLDPLKLWGDILLDGHNRLLICQKYDIPFKTEQVKSITNEDEAIIWIINNQLDKRNITDNERTYLIGKRQEQEKKRESFKGNQYTTSGGVQNELHLKTAEKIGAEYGVSASTVKRAEKFAKKVDEIGKADPELREKIMAGTATMTHEQIANYGEKILRVCSKCGGTDKLIYGENICYSCREARRKSIPVELRLTAPPENGNHKQYDFSEEQMEYLRTVNDFYIDMGRYEIMPKAFIGLDVASEICQITEKIIRRMNVIRTHFKGEEK